MTCLVKGLARERMRKNRRRNGTTTDQVKRDQGKATEESSEPEMKAAVEDSQRREKRTSPPDKLSGAGAVIRERGRQHARESAPSLPNLECLFRLLHPARGVCADSKSSERGLHGDVIRRLSSEQSRAERSRDSQPGRLSG